MPIHTVLGPIEPEELGPTSIHEHLLSDIRLWAKEPTEPVPEGVEFGPELAGYLRWNALSVPENLLLDDVQAAGEELAWAKRAGGSAVVELTLDGMGRQLEKLPEVARTSGMHILVGCGYYVEETMPEEVRTSDIDGLTEKLIHQLTHGIGDTGILPAILGEIGTSWPITDAEWRSVRAAARAGVATGTTVYTHQSFRGQGGVSTLEAILDEGMPVDRVIIGHLDELWDPGYHREIAQSGAMMAYDTFGTDHYYGAHDRRGPSDTERLEMVEWALSEGFGDQLVIGADIWMKLHLHRNGGHGYDQLFSRIAPAIATIAGDQAVADRIMIENPRRLLNRP